MENLKMAQAPMKLHIGEMIDTIEKQQADLYGMTSEIKARLAYSPEKEASVSKPQPMDYLNRLAVITDCNREVLTTLEKILEVL